MKITGLCFSIVFVRYIFIHTLIDLHTLYYWNLFPFYIKNTLSNKRLVNNCCIALTLKSCSSDDFWVSRNGTSAQCRLMLRFKIKDYQEMSSLCKNFKTVPSEEKLQHLKFPLLSFKIPQPNKIETKYIKSKS